MATTVIAYGVRIEGEVNGDSDVKIEGEVIGKLILNSSIYVAINGYVEGEIIAKNVFVTGRYKGQIKAEELVQIGQGGYVDGEILAKNVFISGECRGNITAKELIQLGATGRVHGCLNAPSFTVEKGAIFSGSIEMDEEVGQRNSNGLLPGNETDTSVSLLSAESAEESTIIENANLDDDKVFENATKDYDSDEEKEEMIHG